MITSVDTNVLLDVFISQAPHHAQSVDWLRTAYDRGTLLVCDIVYAELVPAFGERVALNRALREIGVTLSPINTDIAWEAGTRWMQYRRAGGPRKTHHHRLPYRRPRHRIGRRLPHSRPRLLHLLLSRTEESLTDNRQSSAICRAEEAATYRRTGPTKPCPNLRGALLTKYGSLDWRFPTQHPTC